MSKRRSLAFGLWVPVKARKRTEGKKERLGHTHTMDSPLFSPSKNPLTNAGNTIIGFPYIFSGWGPGNWRSPIGRKGKKKRAQKVFFSLPRALPPSLPRASHEEKIWATQQCRGFPIRTGKEKIFLGQKNILRLGLGL